MTTTHLTSDDTVHADGTPPMSAPTYRACACGWSASGSSHSSAVDKLQQHLSEYGDVEV